MEASAIVKTKTDAPLATGLSRVPGVGVVSGPICICQRADPYGRYLMIPCADGSGGCNGWIHPQCFAVPFPVYGWIFDAATCLERCAGPQEPYFCPLCITASLSRRKTSKAAPALLPPLVHRPFTIERILACRKKAASADEEAAPLHHDGGHSHLFTGDTRVPDAPITTTALVVATSTEDEYLIKWKDKSYLHCTWETLASLVEVEFAFANSEFQDVTTREGEGATIEACESKVNARIRRFREKNPQAAEAVPLLVGEEAVEADDGNYFNADYTYVERVIASTVAQNDDFAAHSTLLEHARTARRDDARYIEPPHASGLYQPGLAAWDIVQQGPPQPLYLVKWSGLSYDECTWETREDVGDDDAIRAFRMREQMTDQLFTVLRLQKATTEDFSADVVKPARQKRPAMEQHTGKRKRAVVVDSEDDELAGQQVEDGDDTASDSDADLLAEAYVERKKEEKLRAMQVRREEAALKLGSSKASPKAYSHLTNQLPKYLPDPLDFQKITESLTYGGPTNPLHLHDYQLEGLNWLAFNSCQRRGSILADEMGLGKTAQAVSLLHHLATAVQSGLREPADASQVDDEEDTVVAAPRRRASASSAITRRKPAGDGKLSELFHRISGPFLVVVPLTTLGHWSRELEAWTAGAGSTIKVLASGGEVARNAHMPLNTVVYHGPALARQVIREREFWFTDPNTGVCLGDLDRGVSDATLSILNESVGRDADGTVRCYKFNVLLTTYEMAIADSAVLSGIPWRCVVIDEAHRLKNVSSKIFQCLSSWPRDHCVLLTGTPIQNTIEELWALLTFVAPDNFLNSGGDLRADKTLAKVLSSLQSHVAPKSTPDVVDRASFLKHFGVLEKAEQVECLHYLLRPYLLRRLKEHVNMTLPPKAETIVEVDLSPVQKQYYRAIYERNVPFLVRSATAISRTGAARNLPSLMNIVMELRKVCNHPYLLRGVEDVMVARCKSAALTEDASIPAQVVAAKLNEQFVHVSSKFALLDKLLPRLKQEGHRVLIFSQMVRMLDLLADYAAYRKFSVERLDGRIRGPERQAAIDRFNAPDSTIFIMLLSTRAGGLGVSLTAADTVILFDSDWNPQNDLQAQARVHRIGQKKSVKIFRLITRKSYEQIMFQKASLKLGLDRAVVGTMKSDSDSLGHKVFGGQGAENTSASAQEVERLLRLGAYQAMEEEVETADGAAAAMEEDIDAILSRAVTVLRYDDGSVADESAAAPTKSSGTMLATFNKASFVTKSSMEVDIDDPEFWEKAFHSTDSLNNYTATKPGFYEEMPEELARTVARLEAPEKVVEEEIVADSADESDDELDDSSSSSSDVEDLRRVRDPELRATIKQQRAQQKAELKRMRKAERGQKKEGKVMSILQKVVSGIISKLEQEHGEPKTVRRRRGAVAPSAVRAEAQGDDGALVAHESPLARTLRNFCEMHASLSADLHIRAGQQLLRLARARLRIPWTVLEIRRLASAIRDVPFGRWALLQTQGNFTDRSLLDLQVTATQYVHLLLKVAGSQFYMDWYRGKKVATQQFSQRMVDVGRIAAAADTSCPFIGMEGVHPYLLETCLRGQQLRKAAKEKGDGPKRKRPRTSEGGLADGQIPGDTVAAQDDDEVDAGSFGDVIAVKPILERIAYMLMIRDVVVGGLSSHLRSRDCLDAGTFCVNPHMLVFPAPSTTSDSQDASLVKLCKRLLKDWTPAIPAKTAPSLKADITECALSECTRRTIFDPVSFSAFLSAAAAPKSSQSRVALSPIPESSVREGLQRARAKVLGCDPTEPCNFGWTEEEMKMGLDAGPSMEGISDSFVLPYSDEVFNTIALPDLRSHMPSLSAVDETTSIPRSLTWWNGFDDRAVIFDHDTELLLAIFMHGYTDALKGMLLDKTLLFRSRFEYLYTGLHPSQRLPANFGALFRGTPDDSPILRYAVVETSSSAAAVVDPYRASPQDLPESLLQCASNTFPGCFIVDLQKAKADGLSLHVLDPCLGDTDLAAIARGHLFITPGAGGDMQKLHARLRKLLIAWHAQHTSSLLNVRTKVYPGTADAGNIKASIQRAAEDFVGLLKTTSDITGDPQLSAQLTAIKSQLSKIIVAPGDSASSEALSIAAEPAKAKAAPVISPDLSACKIAIVDAAKKGQFILQLTHAYKAPSAAPALALDASSTVHQLCLHAAQATNAKWPELSVENAMMSSLVEIGVITEPAALNSDTEDDVVPPAAVTPAKAKSEAQKKKKPAKEVVRDRDDGIPAAVLSVDAEQAGKGLALALDTSKTAAEYVRLRTELLIGTSVTDKLIPLREALRMRTAGSALTQVISSLERSEGVTNANTGSARKRARPAGNASATSVSKRPRVSTQPSSQDYEPSTADGIESL